MELVLVDFDSNQALLISMRRRVESGKCNPNQKGHLFVLHQGQKLRVVSSRFKHR